MGTRNLTCVVQGGDFKVAQYGQWDGYPTGQGATILAFLADADRERFADRVSRCRFATEAEIEKAYEAFSNNGMMTVDQSKAFAASPYGYLSRDTGAGILAAIYDSQDGLMVQDARTFAGDSLFCEWAYVIDLDAGTLEVYKGFNTDGPVPADSRFAFLNPDPSKPFKPEYDGDRQYFPVTLVKSYPLDALPTVEQLDAECDPPEPEETEEPEAVHA